MSGSVSIPIIHQPDADVQADWRRWVENAPAVIASGGSGGGRVLLISYTFPPTGGSGVQRPAKLARYLPEFGWSVEVLAAGHGRFPWRDDTLLADLPADTPIHRVTGHEPACLAEKTTACLRSVHRQLRRVRRDGDGARGDAHLRWLEDRLFWRLARWTGRLGLGDGESLWVEPAARAARRRHAEQPFDAVVSTGPPAFVHQVALRLSRTASIPWIADVRDPFTSDHDGPTDPRRAERMRRIERLVMENASAIVTTCQALAADLGRRYPGRTVWTLTNGFDRDDLLAVLSRQDGPSRAPSTFDLVAAGSFYGQRELSGLIGAVSKVLQARPQWQGRVRLTVAGTLDARQRRRWEQDRPEWLRLAGYLDHISTLALVRSAPCAVLIAPACNHTRLCVPGKMFELMALPVHILGLVPEGSETQRLLQEAGACTIAPYENARGTARALESVMAAHFAGRLACGRRWEALDRFDRRLLAARWADCLAHSAAVRSGR